MNNSIKSAWSQDLSSEDMLDVLRQRVDEVAAENAQHRSASRQDEQLEAARRMRADAKAQLLAYNVNIDDIPDRVLGEFGLQVHALVTGRITGLGISDLARQLQARSDAFKVAVEAQKHKPYTVTATKRTDSLGALNVSYAGRPAAHQHVRLVEYRGVAQKTLNGFSDDGDAIRTLGNPVNAKQLLGAECRPEMALPDTLESLAELKATIDAPNLEDYVLVIVGDSKLKNIDCCIGAPLLDLPRLTTRDLPTTFKRREEQRAHFVTITIPSARVAAALANQITADKKIPKGLKTTTVASKLTESL